MGKDFVDVDLPARDVEVLELIGKKVGKTASEVLVECIERALNDPDKFMERLVKEAAKAKGLGLTLLEYTDRQMECALKELKG